MWTPDKKKETTLEPLIYWKKKINNIIWKYCQMDLIENKKENKPSKK